MLDDIIMNKFPKLDLHGEIIDVAMIRVEEFIFDNYKLKNKDVVIVHGKGTGLVKKAVYEVLKRNKLVERYRISYFNDGCTIVKIKQNM